MTLIDVIDPEDDRAVSPVIGVILMVAVTVILAAVVGTFVLGLGDQLQETAPNAQISITSIDEDNVTFVHNGGDTFTADNTVEIRVTAGGTQIHSFSPEDFEGQFRAGDDLTTDGGATAGDTVRIAWVGEDRSNVLTQRQA